MSQQLASKAFALKRIIAFIYDLLLIIPLMMVMVLIWLPFNNGLAIEPDNPLYPFMITTCAILTPMAFYTYFWHKGGQTLGMHSWRLKAVTSAGKPLTLKQSFIRAMLFVLSIAIIYLGLKNTFLMQFSALDILCTALALFLLCGLFLAFSPTRVSLIDRITKTHIAQLPKTKK